MNARAARRLGLGVGPRVREPRLACPPGGRADETLVRLGWRRRRGCPRPRTRSSPRSRSVQRGEVGGDVRVEVPRRVVHLVQQLLANRVERDHAAGARRLGDHGGRRRLVDLGDRERDSQRIGVLPPRARVVAARDLAAALEQVADDDTGGEPVPVVPRPAELVHERRDEQRRVGDPARDDDVGARSASASAIGRAPRYAFANSASSGSPSSAARARTSSPTTVATVTPEPPSALTVSATARPAAIGLMPPALVMSFVSPSSTYGSAAADVRGEIAGVAERFVALAVLLQDGQRQLGQAPRTPGSRRRRRARRRRARGRRRRSPDRRRAGSSPARGSWRATMPTARTALPTLDSRALAAPASRNAAT